MIEENGETLIIAPYERRDFKSHGDPQDVYNGKCCMEVSSIKLCHIIASVHHWELSRSYRVPGKIYAEQNVVLFSLAEAKKISIKNE